MEQFWNKISLTGGKWSSLNARGIKTLWSHSLLLNYEQLRASGPPPADDAQSPTALARASERERERERASEGARERAREREREREGERERESVCVRARVCVHFSLLCVATKG